MKNANLSVLHFHEAESYICHPKIIIAASKAIGSQEELPTEDEIRRIILERLDQQKLKIAMKRCFSESTLTVRMSLEKSLLTQVDNVVAALEMMREKSTEEIKKAAEAMSMELFESRLKSEIDDINKIIADKDVNRALAYLPGKELLAELAPKSGCKNGTDLMRSVKRNLKVEDYEVITQLRQELPQ